MELPPRYALFHIDKKKFLKNAFERLRMTSKILDSTIALVYGVSIDARGFPFKTFEEGYYVEFLLLHLIMVRQVGKTSRLKSLRYMLIGLGAYAFVIVCPRVRHYKQLISQSQI